MNQDEKYLQAKKRVEKLKGFYIHLFIFIIVNIGLFINNFLTGPENGWWFIYPLIGWGIGLASHAFIVFGQNTFFGDDWEERKIKKYMDED